MTIPSLQEGPNAPSASLVDAFLATADEIRKLRGKAQAQADLLGILCTILAGRQIKTGEELDYPVFSQENKQAFTEGYAQGRYVFSYGACGVEILEVRHGEFIPVTSWPVEPTPPATS